jgi:hypothetical protein
LFARAFHLLSETAARCRHLRFATEETVDGRDSGLEISARSSYVPSLSISGVRSRHSGEAQAKLRDPRAWKCPENRNG